MKIILTALLLVNLAGLAQKPNKALNHYRIDTMYSNLQSASDTNLYKPVVANSSGKYKKFTYWPSAGGGGGISGLTAGRVPYAASSTTLTDDGDMTFNGTTLVLAGNLTNGTRLNVGTVYVQPYGTNNSFIAENIYFDGSNFKRVEAGAGGLFYFQGDEGQFRFTTSSTGGSTATMNTGFKTNADGTVAIGGDISTTGGAYTGATLIATGDNVLIGGTSTAASAVNGLHIYNGTAPSASVANGIVLYSEDVAASAELKVRDEAGNITVLGPHTFTGIPGGRSEEMAWAFYSERDGKYINVDMLKLARAVEKLTGEKLVFIGKTTDELPNKENK